MDLDSTRYDITAKPAGSASTAEMYGPMMQSLLDNEEHRVEGPYYRVCCGSWRGHCVCGINLRHPRTLCGCGSRRREYPDGLGDFDFSKLARSGPEIDSVIGFNPAVFSISAFTDGATFSTWSTTQSNSPSAGTYDYKIIGSASLSGSTSSPVDYTVLTFTPDCATRNATQPGNSNVLILQNDSGSVTTTVTSDGQPLNLVPAPSNSFLGSIDATIDVTGASTPEPATFLLIGLPLAGLALLRRRAKQ